MHRSLYVTGMIETFMALVALTDEYVSPEDPSSLTFGVSSSAFSEYLAVLRIARPEDVNFGCDSCKVNGTIGLYREYAIAIQDEVGDSNGGNV